MNGRDAVNVAKIRFGCVFAIIVLFGIVNIIVSSVVERDCATSVAVGLNISEWLLISGIINLGLSAIGLLTLCRDDIIYPVVIMLFGSIFGLIWFIIGGVVIFQHENVKCIDAGGGLIIYCLVLWCISAYNFVLAKESKNNTNSSNV